MSIFLQFSWATPENLSVSNCSVVILVTTLYISCVSNTSEVNFITKQTKTNHKTSQITKAPTNKHKPQSNPTRSHHRERWTPHMSSGAFLRTLPGLKPAQQDPERSPVVSGAQSPRAALAIQRGHRAPNYSLWSSLKKKSASRLTELCCDYPGFKALLESLCERLLCALSTDVSSLTSGSKCNEAETISFDPLPLDYGTICLASEHETNYREGT